MEIDARIVTTRTDDGVLLHGALSGASSQEGALGVLVVHGAWGNFYATPPFQLVAEGPSRGLTVLSLNGRGHDLGTLGDGEPCIGFIRERFEDAPRDLDAALDVLLDAGVQRVVVVAHSYGSHRTTYWLEQRRPPEVEGVALLSPSPPLEAGARWFVDGSAEHHVARAARAVAEGEPERLIVLSDRAPVPMVAEAATVLSVWGPETLARSEQRIGQLDLPLLVTVGGREPGAYHEQAETLARLGRGRLEVLDDDHYYQRDRSRLVELVLEWISATTAETAPRVLSDGGAPTGASE